MIKFPDPSEADESGLLCYGGDLKSDTLLSAYSQGIFPWYNAGEPILWWSPDPRCVLLPERLKISASMQALIKKDAFKVTYNMSFIEVVNGCSQAKRKGQEGTWIHGDMIEAYVKMHEKGHAISTEIWKGEKLVGGLYGIRIGRIFFGESMFSLVPNASKYGFIHLVQKMRNEGVILIDCQQTSKHLISLGAEEISRSEFHHMLKFG